MNQSFTYPGKSSDAVEQENHGNDGTSGSCVTSLTVNSGTGSPYGESDQHAEPSDQEQLSAAKLVDREGHANSDEERPQLETAVDQRLIVGAGDADRIENVVDIVRDKSIARALREESRQDDQEHSLPVSWSTDQHVPTLFAVLFLELDRLLDFGELGLDEVVIRVPVCMILASCQLNPIGFRRSRKPTYLYKNLIGFVCPIFGAQPLATS